MRWTYEHDIYLGREILLIKPCQYKSGFKESGNAWSSIAEDLNKIAGVHFDVNQKGVRDRCRNLLEKQKKDEKGILAPMRKILNLIIYCKAFLAGSYLPKVNYRNTRTKCEIRSKLSIKTPERRHAEESNAEDLRRQAIETQR